MTNYTVERLREWAEALEREQPGSIGETLLRYAQAWEHEVEVARSSHKQYKELYRETLHRAVRAENDRDVQYTDAAVINAAYRDVKKQLEQLKRMVDED